MVLTFVKRLYLTPGLREVQLWSSGEGFSRVDVETVAVAVWLLSLSPALSLCTDRTPPNEAAVAQRRSLNARDHTNVDRVFCRRFGQTDS